MPRVFTLSDLHVDYAENMQQMHTLSAHDYQDDALIISGDVTDSLSRLGELLVLMQTRFNSVSFVPGNHELWLRDGEHQDSLKKFSAILDLCEQLGVHTKPSKFGSNAAPVWLIPLFSWYRHSEDGEHSLYVRKQGEDWKPQLWMDSHYCKWPTELPTADAVAHHFSDLNRDIVSRNFDAPVISFSHFLPRKELLFDSVSIAEKFRDSEAYIPMRESDPLPMFNFTRVAGCGRIDQQLRQLGSELHIYGHQHRQRCREIDGVIYVSNCVGYARERKLLGARVLPRLVWEDGSFIDAEDRM